MVILCIVKLLKIIVKMFERKMYDCKIRVPIVIICPIRIYEIIIKIKHLIYCFNRLNNEKVVRELKRNDLKQWFFFLYAIKTNHLSKWNK